MRRTLLIASLALVAIAFNMLSSFLVSGQKRNDTRTKKFEELVRDNDLTSDEYWKVTRVTAQTLARLPAGGKYMLDLKGAIYEFDSAAGPIDFKRVAIRTARGESLLGPLLEAALSKDELARWSSRGFRMGSPADFHSDERSASVQMGFTCDANYCDCSGQEDCHDMLFHGCGGVFFACTKRTGTLRCICSRS